MSILFAVVLEVGGGIKFMKRFKEGATYKISGTSAID
jgi:hypothetical protein